MRALRAVRWWGVRRAGRASRCCCCRLLAFASPRHKLTPAPTPQLISDSATSITRRSAKQQTERRSGQQPFERSDCLTHAVVQASHLRAIRARVRSATLEHFQPVLTQQHGVCDRRISPSDGRQAERAGQRVAELSSAGEQRSGRGSARGGGSHRRRCRGGELAHGPSHVPPHCILEGRRGGVEARTCSTQQGSRRPRPMQPQQQQWRRVGDERGGSRQSTRRRVCQEYRLRRFGRHNHHVRNCDISCWSRILRCRSVKPDRTQECTQLQLAGESEGLRRSRGRATACHAKLLLTHTFSPSLPLRNCLPLQSSWCWAWLISSPMG